MPAPTTAEVASALKLNFVKAAENLVKAAQQACDIAADPAAPFPDLAGLNKAVADAFQHAAILTRLNEVAPVVRAIMGEAPQD
jgi:hypothetical protein